MIEQQFIQFSATVEPQTSPLIPVVLDGRGIEFFVPDNLRQTPRATFSIVDPTGTTEYGSKTKLSPAQNVKLFGQDGEYTDTWATEHLSIHTAFRFKYSYTISGVPKDMYSNVMMIAANSRGELKHLRYKCNEPMGGFPFNGSTYASAYVPIQLRFPNWQQDEEVYTKLNGEKVVLASTKTKEYEAATDYIPEEWHDKILTALMCDEVYLDGERFHKSEKYNVNWEESIIQTKRKNERLARAEFKMIACTLTRNTNS